MVVFYLWHRFHGRRAVAVTFGKSRIEPGTEVQTQGASGSLIDLGDSLLAQGPEDMGRVFYRLPRGNFIDWSYDCLLTLKGRRGAGAP